MRKEEKEKRLATAVGARLAHEGAVERLDETTRENVARLQFAVSLHIVHWREQIEKCFGEEDDTARSAADRKDEADLTAAAH